MSLENIISKFVLNKTDQQELEQLQEWQAEAQDNAKALEEMQQIFAMDMSEYKSYSKKDAWSNIESQIAQEENFQSNEPAVDNTQPGHAKVFQLKKWIMSAAAVITLLAATTVVWQKYTTDSYQTHYVAATTQQSANLPDQSVVNLDKGTTLDIISEDYTQNRALKLDGRAFFEVAKDAAHPFTVTLPQGKITVLGTQFNINTADNKEEIYVTEGHVRYDIADRSFDLRAGDYIKVIDGDVIKVAMNDDNYLSWKSGKLVLDNVNLAEAVKSLQNHYQASISISSQIDVAECKISTTLEQETLTEALEELAILLSLEYNKTGDEIMITDIKC